MDNKIEKLGITYPKDSEHLEVLSKIDEVIGMVNEHTDKLNELIKKVNLNHKLIEEVKEECETQNK